MDCKCEICGAEVEDKAGFLSHIKTEHKLTAEKYCLNLGSKIDPISGEEIPFKSFEQYCLTNFISRKNYLAWLKKVDGVVAIMDLMVQLKSYRILKEAEFFPSQSELRTMPFLVSMKTYVYFFGEKNLYDMMDSIGLKKRFSYFSDLKFNIHIEDPIVVDTREQKPIKFKSYETVSSKLDYGDYSLGKNLAIERKSLSDLLSTLSSGFERFKREIERAQELGGYIVVLTDCDINQFLSFNYNYSGKYSQASSEFIFHRLRDVCKNYPETIQFAFSGGRRESGKLIPLLLSWGRNIVSKLDIEYYIENGNFKPFLE